jgi:hypothetical protein
MSKGHDIGPIHSPFREPNVKKLTTAEFQQLQKFTNQHGDDAVPCMSSDPDCQDIMKFHKSEEFKKPELYCERCHFSVILWQLAD